MSLFSLFEIDRELMTAHLHDVFVTGRSSVEASIVARNGVAIPLYMTGFRIVADGIPTAVGVGIDVSRQDA